MELDLLGIDASRASLGAKTGTEWYSREIIRAMATLDDRPRLRLYQREPERFVHANRVEWQPIDRQRLWTHLGLANEMRATDIDALFVPAHVIPWRHPKTTVVTIHDLGYLQESRSHTLKRRITLDLTTRWNARAATRIITPSEQTRDDLAREYGVASSKIDVIPHGVDRDRFRPLDRDDVANVLRELGIRQPFLLFISTIQPRKNLSRLISAFETLDRPDLSLVIAGGDGWKSAPIAARMESSARSADILRLGYVADEFVPALYNGAEAFVLPSLFEGFGMGVLEAMACGCPVVTSNTTSLAEVAGDAAITVDPRSVTAIREGIVQALNPDERARFRRLGLDRAGQFTWERAASETLDSIRRAYQQASR
ncbi:MAG: glycosyltransferase family 1 protein [Thermomicrobiales bacterium]